MLILTLVMLMGDPVEHEPDSINAFLFLKNGKTVEVSDVRIKDLDPWSFAFETGDRTIRVNILQVVRMRTLKKSRKVEVLFNDGTAKVGRISAFELVGKPVATPNEVFQYQIRDVARIHFVSGAQLRSCFNGHFEKRTPYPYCPVCGNKLELGPYVEDPEVREQSAGRDHLHHITERN